jgi:deazaflavin-dependent oxidoreductase (nitroreductase family)
MPVKSHTLTPFFDPGATGIGGLGVAFAVGLGAAERVAEGVAAAEAVVTDGEEPAATGVPPPALEHPVSMTNTASDTATNLLPTVARLYRDRVGQHHERGGSVSDWNTKIIEEFRANEGKVGGGFAGAPLLLLHTRGRKSGQDRVSPMMYLADGDRLLVFASKGGHPHHPEWYLNLVADPAVTVEVGTETFPAQAIVVTGDERDRLYAEQSSRYPGFAEYQQNTTRIIPVVALTKS